MNDAHPGAATATERERPARPETHVRHAFHPTRRSDRAVPAPPAARSHPAAPLMDETTHDQWELAVAQIWVEVLEVPAAAPTETLADLGADASRAAAVLATVADRLGVDLRSVGPVTDEPLAVFARRVRAAWRSTTDEPDMVRLGQRSGPALFCFPGAGALGLTFAPMSRHLADRDLYVFQQHALERRGRPDWSVTAYAERSLELLRRVQPHGPYVLVGHSLGGLVALEVASMLVDQGEDVTRVVLLDTRLPRSTAEQGAEEFAKLAERVEAEERTGLVTTLRLTAERQLRRVLPGGLPQLGRVSRRLRAYTTGVVRYRGQAHFDAFYDQAMIMLRKHRVRPYDGAVTVVLADANPDGPESWRAQLGGPLDIPSFPSEHSSLLREPDVSALVTLLRGTPGF